MKNDLEKMNRNFKGVWFPSEIWLCKELSFIEKGLLLEIDSLDNENNCFAGNDYFAEFFNCSVRTIIRAINKLKKMGFIETVDFDGRHRRIKSLLFVKIPDACHGRGDKMSQQTCQNVTYNNIVNNTINDSHTDCQNVNKENEPKMEKGEAPYKEILSLYNEIAKGNMPVARGLDTERKKHINARWQNDLKTLDEWRQYFNRIKASDFLCGRIACQNDRPFTPGLSWFINPANYLKIIEGNYDNKVVPKKKEADPYDWLYKQVEKERLEREKAGNGQS